jgi:hypothetical protein
MTAGFGAKEPNQLTAQPPAKQTIKLFFGGAPPKTL